MKYSSNRLHTKKKLNKLENIDFMDYIFKPISLNFK